ncbi:MAG: VWA domain-containing protein [Deltaproteobacteria bacterium]|nr:VWA domain-containing protein [Deltaproteobacteria bacterium]
MATADPHTIESDLYDRAAIARLRAGSLAWRKLDEEGGRLVPHFAALLDDLFCALFKYNVVKLPAASGLPSVALNRAILDGVIAGPAYPALRPQTLLDETHAGLATVSIGEELLRALREDRVLTAGDLLDLWSLAREEERVREAEEEAEVADELARAEEGESETPSDAEQQDADGDEADPTSEETSEGDEPDPGASRKRRGSQAMREAAEGARHSARVAVAERRQKERHVEESLARVRSRLDRSITGAAAKTATKVSDLPDALASWGRGLGAGGRLDPGQRIDLGRRLADQPKLKKLARLFGRMRDNALAVRRRVLDRANEEVYEVGRHRSLDDLARLVPHELLALSHPVLRRDFRRRLLDGGLLTYALRGADSRGHGPIVVCLDTSSSMSGDKEIWSKAVTLTFVEIARRQRRRCHVVCFSDARSLREFDMNPRSSYEVALEATLDLAEHFSGGGTDFMTPLDAAVEKLATRALRRADVVLITDGECAVDPEWREEFLRAKKRRNFALYAILIDRGSIRGDTVEGLADRVSRISELTEDARELFTEASAPPKRRRAG